MKFNRFFKRACAALVLGVTCFGLASCGSEDTTHTVVFYHTMGDDLQTVLSTAITKFEQKFPGWKVSASQIGGYDDVKEAVIADLTGFTQPDLAYCYADHVAQYIETGKVVDLTKYINSTSTIAVTNQDGTTTDEIVGYTATEIADFISSYYNEGLATNFSDYDKYGYEETAMLTLPYVKSTEVLYYNATALIECGITEVVDGKEVAKVPTTWDELWDACEIIKAKYPKGTPLGYDSESNWFITMCEQNGWGYTQAKEPHYLFNNDNTKEWLDLLTDKYNAKLFTTQTDYGSYTSNLFVKGAAEGTVFSIGSSGGASHQASTKFEWGVAPLPGSKLADGTVNSKVISQGPSLCMFRTENENADEKELMTWEFMKILLDPVYQCSFSIASGYNPVRISAYDVEEYQTFLDGDSIVAVTANVARTMTEDFFTSPAFVGSSTARTQVGTALVYAFTEEKTATKALADALAKCGG